MNHQLFRFKMMNFVQQVSCILKCICTVRTPRAYSVSPHTCLFSGRDIAQAFNRQPRASRKTPEPHLFYLLAMALVFLFWLCPILCFGTSPQLDAVPETTCLDWFDIFMITVVVFVLSICWLLGWMSAGKGKPKVSVQEAAVQCPVLPGNTPNNVSEVVKDVPFFDFEPTVPRNNVYLAPHSARWHSNPKCHHIQRSKVQSLTPCSSCQTKALKSF